MSKSNIEWTNQVWNPTTGCTKISPGCANCYAETLTKRYAGQRGWPAEFKPWTPANAAENVVLHPDRLDAPLHWEQPSMVFVDSMSDLFHENVPDDYIDKVFAVMALTPQHTYQVLTKRPERMRAYLTRQRCIDRDDDRKYMPEACVLAAGLEMGWKMDALFPWPLPNVWLGVTVENQHWADVRIPILLDTPAAVRFVSAEPLLERVDLGLGFWVRVHGRVRSDIPGRGLSVAGGIHRAQFNDFGACSVNGLGLKPAEYERAGQPDWVIVGGESGRRHRLFDPRWARSIVAQCAGAGVACFVKQLGGARPGNKLDDLPEDLRVREFPS